MFGYVMPYKPELKIREYEIFRGYYCGLCYEIGKKSQLSRLTLTYDMVFMGLILSSVYMNKDILKKKVCPFKLKKVPMINFSVYMEYAADMNILLANRKLIDNYQDDRSYASLIASKFVNTNKFSALALAKTDKIDYNLKEIYKLEKLKSTNIDELSHYFGQLTAELFKIENDRTGRILSEIGYNLGKWIYTLDALDDLVRDFENNKYNPLINSKILQYMSPVEYRTSIIGGVEFSLYKYLENISKAFELLQLNKNREIIENVVYFGMRNRTETILGGKCGDEQSIRNAWGTTRCFGSRDKNSI